MSGTRHIGSADDDHGLAATATVNGDGCVSCESRGFRVVTVLRLVRTNEGAARLYRRPCPDCYGSGLRVLLGAA